MNLNKTFETTAVWYGKYYHHFGIHESLASLYGDDPDDIQKLKLKISEDQTIPESDKNVDYWGWLPKDEDKFNMIYPAYFLLDMCFPAGIVGTEKAGQGKAYRLKIIET
jgi:hypothetical protein